MEVFTVLFALTFFSKVSSECLEFPPMNNFNSSIFYNSRWYLTKSYNQLIPYLDGNCAFMDFTKQNELVTSIVDFNGENRRFEFNYELLGNNVLSFSFNMSVPLMGIFFETDTKIFVLDTDYIHYGLIYGCGNTMQNNSDSDEMVLILSRDRTLDAKHHENIFEKLKSLDLKFELKDSKQDSKKCP